MKYLYVISCVCQDPWGRSRHTFSNTGFLTEKEAIDFCKYHTSEYERYTWSKVQIGKFKTPKSMKKRTK